MALSDADAYARRQIERLRDEMSDWRRKRAERIAAEKSTGKSVEDIAAELGLSVATIYEVLRAVPKDPANRRGRPRKSDRS